MSEPEESEKPETSPDEAADDASSGEGERGVGTFLYRVALAGVGALVLAQEELEGRLRKLRGEGEAAGDGASAEAGAAEPGGTEFEPEAAEAGAAEGGAPPRRTLAEHIDVTVSRVLHSLHVPTRGEVDELTRRVDEIRKRLENLRS